MAESAAGDNCRSDGAGRTVRVTGTVTGSPRVSGVVSVMLSLYWPADKVVGLTATVIPRLVRPLRGERVNHRLPPVDTITPTGIEPVNGETARVWTAGIAAAPCW